MSLVRPGFTLRPPPSLLWNLCTLATFFRLWTWMAPGVGVYAQINAPSCNSELDFQWAFNSLQQDPCVVAVYLVQPCNPEYGIPIIASNESYSGPNQGQDNPCQCSSVTYMLLSACSACQGGGLQTWEGYKVNCSTIYLDVYPGDIPAATKVPHWAYQNVTAEGVFIPSIAEAAGDAPESTTSPSPTDSTSPSPTIPVAPTITSSTTPSKKSIAGPIAGGVIGGVALIFITAITAMYLRRRQRRRRGATRKAPSAAMVNILEDTKPRPYLVPTLGSNAATRSDFHASAPVISAPPKFYNPGDPSTYPSGPPLQQHRPEAGQGHSPQSSETGVTAYFSTGYHSVMPTTRQPMGIPPEL
ncbi:hypothetical protein BDP27DRAFT_1315570 [Rhodocollybia butyracea]|uniref:Uncharacterized protein n=1 Tax=Rhodocollybia butyracea TaxID=206335 RepID=A0A9P5UDG7_9AGAR|nr:hypothetical protein BDP27DRAFT_1315570 [Rhodocollybia butyracea]